MLTEIFKRTLLLVLLRRLAVHKIVEALATLEEIVDTAHDAEDTEGEDPDTDDSDDAGLATNEPTEDTEEGGEDVDNQDSTRQLPRGNGRPEGTVGTGDEDQPVLGKRDLEEEDLVADTEVLDDTTADTLTIVERTVLVREHGGEGDPGTDGQDDTEKDGHTPELGQVPLDGSLAEGRVVVGNGQGGNISENGDEDNELEVERGVQDGDPQTQEDLEMERKGDTVDNVGVHAVENLARSLEGVDDGRETRGKEDDIGSRASGVRRTLDGNTSIGLLERRGVVDTVTSHGNEVTTLLENLDDVVLVLGEDLGETIGSLDEIVDLGTGHFTATTKTKTFSVVDVGTKTELARRLPSDTDGITSQHLDGQTKGPGLVDSAASIVTGRVRAGHDAENLPRVVTALASDTERTETTGSELGDLVLVGLVDSFGDGVVLLDGLENEKRGALDTDDTLALRGLDNGHDLLGDGVEGVEVNNLVLAEDGLGARVELEGLEESLVDGINTLLLAGGGQAGSQHEVFRLDTGDRVGLGERELVLGQSTGLVRAENFDTSEGLDGAELLDDGLLLGEVGGTDSHGGGDDSGETDGHTDDGDGQGELEDVDDAVGAVERADPDDQEGGNDQDEQNRTDTVEHLSEVTSATGGAGDEGGSATDEGGVTSGGDDDESLTTLDSGGSVADIALVLVDGERLAGDGRLIDLEESVFGDNATVGGDDGTLLDLEDITRDDLGRLDLGERAVTEDSGLEGERLLELGDDGTGLVFLDETNEGVEQEQTADDTEIDPILETGGEHSGGLHDELNGTDEEHEELEDHVFLLLCVLLACVDRHERQAHAPFIWLRPYFLTRLATSAVVRPRRVSVWRSSSGTTRAAPAWTSSSSS